MSESRQTLHAQLLATAEQFSADRTAFAALLQRMADDIERATAEPLEIFPVCHHSPASALHMAQRLQQRPPRAIYIELCEDLRPLAEDLRECSLPVALQGFAAESDWLPSDLLPIAVVTPLTEASAEVQAIAFALNHPECELVFVDRPSDLVFQWDADWQQRAGYETSGEPEEAALHGHAVGLSLGALEPTFDEFLRLLLRNSNTRHFAEWWDQYVEQAIIDSEYTTYREVMFLIGSLMRHLGRRSADRAEDELRERYMWTRIKQHLRATALSPSEAIFICGAAHSASGVAEFGSASAVEWDLPATSATRWQHGIIPSSYAAIEQQFQHPAGTVGLAETRWKKALKQSGVRPFSLAPSEAKPPARPRPPMGQRVAAALLNQPPAAAADQEQLLHWSAQIVASARRHGYLASTADSIAIYQTAILLANLRNRPHPTPFDFEDAAITCLEKERTPRRRTIGQLCRTLLGGDRIGKVGYASLPPLAQDIYDRLAPLGIDLQSRTNQRALIDLKANPGLRPCSDLLWKLRYLLGDSVVEPIVGSRVLGVIAIQESWDVRIGRTQRDVIQLGYEGVSLEQVFEQRLKRAAFGEQATANRALGAAEDALLYTQSSRLVRELGLRATELLSREDGAHDAPEIFSRARRLVHYYRATPNGLPEWLNGLVATGYGHYAALLPKAFSDQGTTPRQIAAMLGFIFTLESFALALGAPRSQLLIGVQQAGDATINADKLGLLWAAEWLLGLRSIETIRTAMQQILNDALRLPSLPSFLSGWVLALGFAPSLAQLAVELLTTVFARVDDAALLPLLPGLILQLRDDPQVVQPLIKAAATAFPRDLSSLDQWQPAWDTEAASAELPSSNAPGELSSDAALVRELIMSAPATATALAELCAELA